MFCQECGNPLKEGDKTCKVCGASASGAIDTANSTNEEFVWNLNGFPEPRKTEDINFNWDTEGLLQQKSDGAPPMDSLDELNKFLTFDKANQDFQKLLDEQYKKAEDYSSPGKEDFHERQIDLSGVINGDISETSNIFEKDSPENTNTEMVNEVEKENKAHKNAYRTDGARTIIIEGPESEKEPEPEVIWITHQSREETSNQSREETSNQVQDETGNKSDFDMKTEGEEIPPIETHSTPKTPERSETHETPETPERDAGYVNAPIKEVNYMEIVKQDDHDIGKGEETVAPSENDGNADDNIETDQSMILKAEDKEPALWFDENASEVENGKEGFAVKAILTLIIIILIAEATILGIKFFLPNSRISDKATQINLTVSTALMDIKERVTGLFGGERNPAEETDTDGESDSDTDLSVEPVPGEIHSKDPNPIPMEDKSILIANLLYLNKNIDKVELNDSLKWGKESKYPLSSIDDSKPIENNYWYTTEKNEHVYYDSEIIAAIIKFDSQWQDYVNSNNKEVIDLTKEGSKARKNVETFSKVGKVEQSFLCLEIGEIRQNKDTFYVWTYEEIKEIRGDKTTINKYKWIYCLEPVDNEIKIVNYYKY